MIKLIVVEDEPLMLDYIINNIDWEKNNIELSGTFFDGKDAFNYISNNKVDIVVTDIRMPGMDGITLIKNAVQENNDINHR